MLIGFDGPSRGPLARPETMVRLAIEGEAMGFGYMTLSDHVVIPRAIHARYPYSATGELPPAARGDWHELLTAAAFIAGKTSRLRLMTSVMVVPHRPAVLTAKMLATIDVLSGGRLTVGCGAGWLEEEFQALGTPPYAERGAVTDEYLQAFRELWTKDAPRFAGRYVKFDNILFAPKPVQQPHPPLWIGGESGPALRRAARLGDGWYPLGSNPQHPLDTLSRYKAGVARLRQLAAEAGRDPAAIALGYRSARLGKVPEPLADNGERRLFCGEKAEIAADLRAFREMGVVAVDLSFVRPTAEETLANMKRFCEQLLPLV